MILTHEQIEALYAFTRKKYVKWYDLQTELVDHLSEQIKEEWEANPTIDFEEALEKVYKNFGIFGFAQIVKERTKSLQKKKRKLMLNGILQEFAWPMFLRSICIFAVFYIFISTIDFTILAVIGFVLLVATFIRQLILDKRQKMQMKESLLSLESQFTHSVFLMIQYGFIVLFNLSPEMETTAGSWQTYFCASVFTLGALMIIVSITLDKKMTAEAKKSYPEAFEIAS